MTWVATAIISSAVIGGSMSSRASKKAARVQGRAADAAAEEQRRQYDLTRGDLQPWMQAGGGALTQQQALLGLSGAEAQQQAYDAYSASPGQQFLRAQGRDTLLAGSSAIGGLGGGNVRKALTEYGIGTAAQDYGNYYNRLAGMSGTGQQTGAQLGQFGANAANQIGAQQIYGGQARASGILGSGQAWANTVGQLGSAAGQYFGSPTGGYPGNAGTGVMSTNLGPNFFGSP